MRFAQRKKVRSLESKGWLKIGFIPTIDSAILIAAQELKLFEKHGLRLKLSKEVGWATIREKLLHEELDAVHAHPSMAFSIYCGLGGVRRSCLTGLVMALNGSAITLSTELWDLGVRDAASLGKVIAKMKGQRTFVFGAVLEYSSQNHHLQRWLRSAGLDPAKDVRIEFVPSPLIYQSFRDGYLDGYCVAEPWNSVAVREETGWIAAVSRDLEPSHPEKVLLVLQDFAQEREVEHLRMLAALIEASAFCEQTKNRPKVVEMLAKSDYFDMDPSLLANSLIGPLNSGRGQFETDDFILFYKNGANIPDRAKGNRVFELMRDIHPKAPARSLRPDVIPRVFRHDIYKRAFDLADIGTNEWSMTAQNPLQN